MRHLIISLFILAAIAAPGIGGPADSNQADGAFDNLPKITPTTREYAPGRSLMVYTPSNITKGVRLPALVFIHGGGWANGKAESFDTHCRYYAARGLVAITVEYRLTSQPGITVFDCIADAKAAIRWVRAHADELGVDPEKIVAVGDSAGGHLAACAGMIPGLEAADQDLTVSSRPNAMVLYYPILDTTMPDGWDLVRFSGKPGAAVAARAREFSPVNHVAPNEPPTLIIHGSADKLIPFKNSEHFTELMLAAGNHVQLEKFEGQDHAFMSRGYGNDATILHGLHVTDAFLQSLGYLPG